MTPSFATVLFIWNQNSIQILKDRTASISLSVVYSNLSESTHKPVIIKASQGANIVWIHVRTPVLAGRAEEKAQSSKEALQRKKKHLQYSKGASLFISMARHPTDKICVT